MSVSVQQAAFDVGLETQALAASNPGIGAIASFIGLVRDTNAGDSVDSLTLEHYPGMTESALEEIVTQAQQRWPLLGVRVIHRYGPLALGEGIVLVLVASAHRGVAFTACEFIMDYLKTRAPFWKKETAAEGETGRWVDARESDETAARRWQEKA